MSASVNLPLHHKVQKFFSGTGSPGCPGKRTLKRLLWWWWYSLYLYCAVSLSESHMKYFTTDFIALKLGGKRLPCEILGGANVRRVYAAFHS